MIIITGGAGFIGSQLIKKLNDLGNDNILVVDNLFDGQKIKNLNDKNIHDYIDQDLFIKKLESGFFENNKFENIFHLGACTDTTELDGKFLMNNNYEYSKILLKHALKNKINFIYASSASVYGLGEKGFLENPSFEMPLNAYAYSKFLFDQFVRKTISKNETRSQIVGLRYFNVYGPGEKHKGRMSSVVNHLFQQAKEKKSISLFAGTGNIKDGEQKRDFIHVDDCIVLKLWLMEQNDVSGIFNCGTGVARSFNDIAKIIQEWSKKELNKNLNIKYIDFPNDLVGKYQNYTCADMNSVKEIGFNYKMKSLEEGVMSYLDYLNRTDKH